MLIGSVEAQSPANNADVNFPYKNYAEDFYLGQNHLHGMGIYQQKCWTGHTSLLMKKSMSLLPVVQNSGIEILVHDKHMSYPLIRIAEGL